MSPQGGTLEVHYAWRDQDRTLVTTGAESERTQLSWNMSDTKYLVADSEADGGTIVPEKLDGELQWYKIDTASTP